VAFERTRLLLLLASLWALSSCASELRRFPLREPLWKDDDQATFEAMPEEYYSPFGWDAADQTIFRPISRFLAVDPAGEAENVNAFDEVPDSSWFQNRIGRFGMTPEEVWRGACDGPPLSPDMIWTIKDAKPDGANPGFVIKAADGRRYLLKFDGTRQGERASTADVFGSRIYHAAGYHAPCNQVVFFDRSILVMADDAESENAQGETVPMTWDDVERVLSKSVVLEDGRYRASASLYLPGRPLGPFTYQGLRDDDPNDAIPHEDRRELRGGYVLASWLNHFDTREQNTLDIWVDAGEGRGYVRHYYLDFGDCLGSMWNYEGISRRLGHAYYLDIPYAVEDAFTLGLVRRPWDAPRLGPMGMKLGYFGVERFVPEDYRTGYPNPAFGRASELDKAWMARIIAEFSEAHVAAGLRAARNTDEALRKEVLRILMGRRAKLLSRWFSKRSPLSHPEVVGGAEGELLCVRDLAIASGVARWSGRRYAARGHFGEDLAPRWLPRLQRPDGERICARLPPASAGAGADYRIVDFLIAPDSGAAPGPLRVHLYGLAQGNRVVGLERPERALPPGG